MKSAAVTVTISEAELQGAVIEAAHLLGWRIAHFRPARTRHGWRTPVAADGKGFPDLALVHPKDGRLLFAEMKADRGRLTAEQKEWIDGLRKVAERCPLVEVHVWTPAQWPADILQALGRQDG